LLEAGGALGLAFDFLQYRGIGESIQNRGCPKTQTITRGSRYQVSPASAGQSFSERRNKTICPT
jgi:hypothetical protein